MLEQIKKFLIDLSKDICGGTVSTASQICDETKKVNSQFVKAIMDCFPRKK